MADSRNPDIIVPIMIGVDGSIGNGAASRIGKEMLWINVVLNSVLF
jgi:hypothetical protein